MEHKDTARVCNWRNANRTYFNATHAEALKARRQRWRALILEHYGPFCNICGYDQDERALCIDHVNNDGASERRLYGSRWVELVIKEGYPDRYQILCHNCNFIKALEHAEGGAKPV